MNKISGKILITRADGFIGSHLVGALIREGCDVRALVFYNSVNSWGVVGDYLRGLIKKELDVLQEILEIP